jgi:acyl-CoA thioester hydrolase
MVTVYSGADDIKNTSFTIRHALHNGEHEIFAEAQDIIVLFDFSKRSKLAIPSELREKIEKISGTGTMASKF